MLCCGCGVGDAVSRMLCGGYCVVDAVSSMMCCVCSGAGAVVSDPFWMSRSVRGVAYAMSSSLRLGTDCVSSVPSFLHTMQYIGTDGLH